MLGCCFLHRVMSLKECWGRSQTERLCLSSPAEWNNPFTEGGSRQQEGKTEDSDVQLREPFEPNTNPQITVRTEGEFLHKYVRKYILLLTLLTSVISHQFFKRSPHIFFLYERLCVCSGCNTAALLSSERPRWAGQVHSKPSPFVCSCCQKQYGITLHYIIQPQLRPSSLLSKLITPRFAVPSPQPAGRLYSPVSLNLSWAVQGGELGPIKESELSTKKRRNVRLCGSIFTLLTCNGLESQECAVLRTDGAPTAFSPLCF